MIRKYPRCSCDYVAHPVPWYPRRFRSLMDGEGEREGGSSTWKLSSPGISPWKGAGGRAEQLAELLI